MTSIQGMLTALYSIIRRFNGTLIGGFSFAERYSKTMTRRQPLSDLLCRPHNALRLAGYIPNEGNGAGALASLA
ncbi:hypothetical protein QU481_02340 [Crenobacter sp. SG2303]|uniref:Uncharacterized protein n=1 Tax=Crenobacter oryzisoli TaxID=3056844 RepID=A0ABT7XJ35_9NEIS|nr:MULTISPECIES: hypothetical protein [unclassified Crenobacter]MDN0073733.1 hypothetical protein [Crenobacter sp. SG2303]MDN0082717.1 hypothetical protein [Crenobacter sp. SG2305]